MEDFIEVLGSNNSGHGSENEVPCASACEAKESDRLPPNLQLIDEVHGENTVILNGLHDSMEITMETDSEKETDVNTSALAVCVDSTESIKLVEKMTSITSVHADNVSLAVHGEISFSNQEKDETVLSRKEKDANSFSGVKRPRVTADEHQPSVHVQYNSLPRESKQKLEELLKQWSQWHSRSCPSTCDSNAILESGEETYFPALHVGLDKASSVTFWVDNQILSDKEFVPLDGTSVPLYDRGFSLALTSADGSSNMNGGTEGLDPSRCFNCGSYNHSLKNCPKPRDNVAVNNARKHHKSKRNQHGNSRNSTRYYQSPQGGKYDGLIPGVLHAETRQLLGLGELDPPPWLNRMRELGYPPGYLDPDVEDQPSGLTIFGDEDKKEECEEGEILDAGFIKPSKKMTVEFPGINAPIPKNADERFWAPPSSSSSYQSREHSHRRHNHTSESPSRWHHFDHNRWSRDLDDDGPPGCEPGTSPSLSYHYRRYSENESGRSPRDSPSTWSPIRSSYRHR